MPSGIPVIPAGIRVIPAGIRVMPANCDVQTIGQAGRNLYFRVQFQSETPSAPVSAAATTADIASLFPGVHTTQQRTAALDQ
ncbi:MAG: hypothetical protein ACR2NP_04675, partial [Pirellulaceae bacterium]